MQFIPRGNRVVVEKIEIALPSGIIMADQHTEDIIPARAISVGPGKHVNGVFVPMDIKPGDLVMYSYRNAQKVRIGLKDTTFVDADSVVGSIEAEEIEIELPSPR